jgi:hypothetical protein
MLCTPVSLSDAKSCKAYRISDPLIQQKVKSVRNRRAGGAVVHR